MKKVLFATTALFAFAGVAAAEVAVSGDARIGMRYDSDLCSEFDAGDCVAYDSAWNVVNRARVKFTMTGQTDSGLEFGAEVRAEEAGRARYGVEGDADHGSNLSADRGVVWVSGSYGKLTAGDIDSAMENALGDLPEVGVSGLDYLNEFGYPSSDYDDDLYNEAGLLYEYSINGVKLFASFMDQYVGNTAVDRDNNAYSLGVAYEMAGYQFGLGYDKSNVFVDPASGDLIDADATSWGLSATGVFGETKVKGVYMTTSVDPDLAGDDDFDVNQYGIGAEYKMANGIGLAGYYRHVEVDADAVAADSDILGLGASYDLGGGATLKGGLVHVSADGEPGDRTMADFGLTFKF